MLIRTTFFTGLDHIELPATSRRGERFADHYNLTTNLARIVEIVRPFAYGLGSVETSFLTGGSATALIYRISDQEVDDADPGGSLARLLVEDLLQVKLLQFNLWMIKDNAARFDRGWIAATTPAQTVLSNNVWETRHSCADGRFESVRFEAEELRAARMHERVQVLHINSTATSTMLTSGSLRFQRFQYFVDGARSSADVAMKIVQYCSGLEALVSTAHNELSHQVSERVAVTLAAPGEQRIALFKLVKEAYGYRSKAVHGASFKPNDAERLRKCAREIDKVCRALVVVYFGPEATLRSAIESSDQIMTDFFVNRTLGAAAEVELDESNRIKD